MRVPTGGKALLTVTDLTKSETLKSALNLGKEGLRTIVKVKCESQPGEKRFSQLPNYTKVFVMIRENTTKDKGKEGFSTSIRC